MGEQPLRVVIAGAGIAGLETALALRELAGDRVDLVLLSLARHAHQQGLPAEAWSLGGLARIPVPDVARVADAELVSGRLSSVDPGHSVVRMHDGSAVPYDVLVIAVGARRVMSFDRGAVMYGGRLDVTAVERILDNARHGIYGRFTVVIPPGAGWALPAHELAVRVAEAAPPLGPQVTLVTYESAPAEVLGPAAAGAVMEALSFAGVRVITETVVEDVEDGDLCFADGGRRAHGGLVAMPYLRGPRVTGLPCDPDGYLPTDPRGAVLERVFAVGDATDFPVKQGGLAVQQAAVVAGSIAEMVGGPPPPPLYPVLRGILPARERCLYFERDLVSGASRVDRGGPEHPAHRVMGGRLQSVLDRLGAASAAL